MLKYNLLNNNQINNIILPLKNNIDFLGSNTFLTEEDLEETDFIDFEISKYILNNNVNFNFRFFNESNYQNNFISAGFTLDEINLSNKKYRYSYILIQLYNTFDSKNQRLLHTGYIPIYLFPDKTQSIFNIDINNRYYEFNNIYINNMNDLMNIDQLYCKFSFFSAKTGKLSLFYNNTINNNTEERIYFKININKENKTYSFNNSNIIAYQFLNEEFINKINERNKTENKLPLYTEGDIFDINGEYI